MTGPCVRQKGTSFFRIEPVFEPGIEDQLPSFVPVSACRRKFRFCGYGPNRLHLLGLPVQCRHLLFLPKNIFLDTLDARRDLREFIVKSAEGFTGGYGQRHQFFQ